MRKEVTKIIKFDEYSEWTGEGKSLVGFKLEKSADSRVGKISFEKLQGKDLRLYNLVNLVTSDFDILKEIQNYLNYNRQEIFHVDIEEGISGCRKATLHSNMSRIGLSTRRNRRCVLHVSMYDKVNLFDIHEMWIGDLIEILRSLDEDFDTKLAISLFSSKKFVRKIREYKYIKVVKPTKKLDLETLLDLYNKEINPGIVVEGGNTSYQYLFKGESYPLNRAGKLSMIRNKKTSTLNPEMYLVADPHPTRDNKTSLIIRLTRTRCFVIENINEIKEISLRNFDKIKSSQKIIKEYDLINTVKNGETILVDSWLLQDLKVEMHENQHEWVFRIFINDKHHRSLVFDLYNHNAKIVNFD